MGINDREQSTRENRKAKAQEKRIRRAHNSGATTPADWSGVDGEIISKAIAAIAGHGGALRLGYTRDGGAYSIGFYGDGEPFTEYVSPNDDIEAYLKGVIEDYGQ